MLFGEYLVKMSILTQDQIEKILKVQVKKTAESGKKKLLGDIAVDLGFVEKNTVEQAFLTYFRES